MARAFLLSVWKAGMMWEVGQPSSERKTAMRAKEEKRLCVLCNAAGLCCYELPLGFC